MGGLHSIEHGSFLKRFKRALRANVILRAKQLCENDSMIYLLINLTRGVGTNTSSCLPESGVKYTNEEASEREQLPKDEHGLDEDSEDSADIRLYFAGRY